MHKRKKLNIIYSAIALFGLILILSVVWIKERNNRFTDYTDEKNGFLLKYPAVWEVSSKIQFTNVAFISPLENDLDTFRENFTVVVQDLSSKPMDLNEYSETSIKQIEAVFGQNFTTLESASSFLDGQPAHKFVYLTNAPEGELKYLNVWAVINQQKVYLLTYTAISSKYNRYISNIEKTVKSFKIK